MNKKYKVVFALGIILLLMSIFGAIQWVARWRYLTQGWEQDIPDPISDTALVGDARLDAPCVNVAMERYSDTQFEQALGWVVDGGFHWIRQKINWADIEVEQGQYDWSIWDNRIASITDHDLELVAVLDQAPGWVGKPPDPQAFAAFAGKFAQRYGQQITYYQIWHNINIGAAWDGYANAYDYTELLVLANQAIRIADSDARIILGSMAPNVEQGDRNYAEDVFLEMLYAAGAGPFFDIVAVQPYGFITEPDDRRVNRDVMNVSRVQLVRQTLIAHGESDKAIWASHFGWNSLENTAPDVPSIWGSVDEQTQATYTIALMNRVADEWPWMGMTCVNILQPRYPQEAQQVPDAEEHWGFALIGPDGEPRAVYNAIKTWAAERDSASAGYYPANTPYASFDGNWTLGSQGADIGETGDSVTLDFIGTGLAVTVRRGPYRAFMYATVDGRPAPALPTDRDGQAYIVLYDPLASMATVPVANGLPYGKHRVTLVADRGWGQWALADWRVINRLDKTQFNKGLVLYSGLAILGVVCLVTTRHILNHLKLFMFLNSCWQRCTSLTKALFSVAASAVYLFAAWHLLIGDGLFRRLGDHGDWLALVLSSGLFYFSHWFILTLIAGSAVVLLVLLRPNLGLVLALFAAPLYLHPVSLFGKSFALSELILLPTVAGVMLSVIRDRKDSLSLQTLWSFVKRGYVAPILLLVVYSLLNSVRAEFRHEALREWRLVILEPTLFFFALISLKLSRRQRMQILDAWVASALMVALVGLVQYFWLGDVITAEGGIRRLRSIYGSPNNVGLYLGRVIPLLLAVVIGWLDNYKRTQEPSGRRIKIDNISLSWRRVWYTLALCPISLALVLSLSRGAIVLGIPAAVLILGLLAGKTWRRLTLVLLCVAAVAMIPILRIPRFAGLFDLTSGTTGFRISLWYSTIQMVRDSPLFGVGLDNFLYAYRTRYVLPTAWEEFNLSHPHNVLLDFASRLGLPGLALFVWIQVIFWRKTVLYLKSRSTEVRTITLGLMASMVNFLAHGMVDASFFVIDLAYIFMLTCAVSVWLARWDNK